MTSYTDGKGGILSVNVCIFYFKSMRSTKFFVGNALSMGERGVIKGEL